MLIHPSRDFDLKKLFSSRLFITRSAFQEILGELFIAERVNWYEGDDIPTYMDETHQVVNSLSKTSGINITDEYESDQIENDSIAYYRIKGLIMAQESWWRFSTKQFRKDLLSAEANPKIIAHFLNVNSGGGEAWYLDVVANTMRSLKKPVVAVYENVAASAAIYLSINATQIYAATANEVIGSIGTMVSFLDIIPYFEKLGAKYFEHYANQSDLKNKKFNDLKDGKPEQYIKEELDPLAEQFISEVINARAALGKLDREDPLFRGETYDTQKSHALGLIDGQKLEEEALLEAHILGANYNARQSQIKKVFQFNN